MTLYAGETAEVFVTAKDFDAKTALTSADVTSVQVSVYSSDTRVLGPATMTYDAGRAGWTYFWDTTGRSAGTYTVQVEAIGTGSTYSLEYGLAVLHQRKAG